MRGREGERERGREGERERGREGERERGREREREGVRLNVSTVTVLMSSWSIPSMQNKTGFWLLKISIIEK